MLIGCARAFDVSSRISRALTLLLSVLAIAQFLCAVPNLFVPYDHVAILVLAAEAATGSGTCGVVALAWRTAEASAPRGLVRKLARVRAEHAAGPLQITQRAAANHRAIGPLDLQQHDRAAAAGDELSARLLGGRDDGAEHFARTRAVTPAAAGRRAQCQMVRRSRRRR